MQGQGGAVTAERPCAGVAGMNKKGFAFNGVHGAVWKLGGCDALSCAAAGKCLLHRAGGEGIDFRDGGARLLATRADEGLPESFRLLAAAFEAGPVAAGQGCRLIQKEEFSIMAGPHQRAAPALEVQPADDPALAGPLPGFQRLVVAVKAAAPVSHEQATLGHCMQMPERISPVLERHGISRAVQGFSRT